MSYPIINGVTYKTKKSLTEAVKRAIKTTLKCPSTLGPRSIPLKEPFWVDFLSYGQHLLEKADKTCPDAFLGFGFMQEGKNIALCTYDTRDPINGVRHLFSYHKIIDTAFDPNYLSSPRRLSNKFTRACRQAIVSQIDAYRESVRLPNDMFTCAATGATVGEWEIDVDHHPVSFKEITAAWGIKSSELDLTYYEDYEHDSQASKFANKELEDSFAEHHATYKNNLRVVTKKVNRSKPKA